MGPTCTLDRYSATESRWMDFLLLIPFRIFFLAIHLNRAAVVTCFVSKEMNIKEEPSYIVSLN